MSLFKPNIEKLKKKRNVEKLIKLINYRKDSDIRQSAVRALGEIGDERAVGPIITVLKDNDIRQSAVWALGEIGDERAVGPIITVLENSQKQGVRQNAAIALGKIGDVRAVASLTRALKDESRALRKFAAVALQQMGWKPPSDELGAQYWIALGEFKRLVEFGSVAVEPLITAFEIEKERHEREKIVYALCRIGDARAVGLLISALKNTDTLLFINLCEEATKALVKIGSPSVKPLISVLKCADFHGANAAAKALGEIGDASAVASLIAALEDEKFSGFSGNVACALGEIGDTRAVKPLITALKHGRREVRQAAAKALIKLFNQTQLDEDIKTRILAVRNTIVERHYDSVGCGRGSHGDEGIGVDFPL